MSLHIIVVEHIYETTYRYAFIHPSLPLNSYIGRPKLHFLWMGELDRYDTFTLKRSRTLSSN